MSEICPLNFFVKDFEHDQDPIDAGPLLWVWVDAAQGNQTQDFGSFSR